MTKVFLLCLISCLSLRSVYAEVLTVSSFPEEAEVYIKDPATDKVVTLGKTPLKMLLKEIKAQYTSGPNFIIEIKKAGYEPYRVLISTTDTNMVNLKANLQISKEVELTKKIDQYAASLFEAQRHIRSNNLDAAMVELDKAEALFPHVSTAYELKGSISYLRKDYTKSLSYYRKAVSTNPENVEAYNMKEYLEKNFASKGAKQ